MNKYPYIVEIDEQGWSMYKFQRENALIEYLLMDMQSFREAIFHPYFLKVISDRSEREMIGGNMCYIDTRKDLTIISMEFIPNDVPNDKQFDTKELVLIIESWIEDNKGLLL